MTMIAKPALAVTLPIWLYVLVACSGGAGTSSPPAMTVPVEPDTPPVPAEGAATGEDPAACVARVRASGLDGFHIARICGPLSVIPGGRKVVSREGKLPYVVSTDRDPYPAGSDWSLYLGQTPAPVIETGARLHIGPDVAPPAGALEPWGARDGVALSKGDVRDGEGAARTLAWVRTMADANLEPGIVGLQTWRWRPELVLVGEADARFVRLARDAAGIVNAALPFGRRIDLSTLGAHYTDREVASLVGDNKHGRIYLRVRSRADPWWSGAVDTELGRTRILKYTLPDAETGREEVTGDGALWSDVVLDPGALASFADAEITHVIVHELLHAMGFMSHTDDTRFRSTLSEVYVRGSHPRGLIHGIDREGLLAAYARFRPGALPGALDVESLGPWTDTTQHLRGDLDLGAGEIAFGVAWRNGLAQPWVAGPRPAGELAANRALTGTVTWNGALLGMTPDGEAVVGDTALALDMEDFRREAARGLGYGYVDYGRLAFTGLRYEGGGRWGEGGLAYRVRIDGNGFRDANSTFNVRAGPTLVPSGEDFGVVTGAFFGTQHEGIGGVLERHDLSAAFGGRR